MNYEKIYVEVIAKFFDYGGIRPLKLIWEDGRTYEIDKVKQVEQAPSNVASVMPVRYLCVIGGKNKYLYYEADDERWFVEKPV